MHLRFKDLSENEFKAMHSAILELLEDYGVFFEDEEAAVMLKNAGNRLDSEGRVHLKPEFVDSMIKMIPASGFTMYGRDESVKLKVAPGEISFRASTGAPFVLDYKSGMRRNAAVDDARIFTLLTDALPGYGMVHSIVSPVDVPGGLENVYMFIYSHRYSLKPSDITVMSKEEVNVIAQISAAIRGGRKELKDKPLTAVDIAMITPLRCAGEQTKAILECAKWGIPIEVLTAPAMGMTAPVTLAGSVAVAMAEFFAAVCLAYLVSPGLGMIITARISPTNMRTTAYNYGAPELGMGSALISALCERYNVPSNLYGFGTNAKTPGAQAQSEKLFSALAVCMGNPHMVTGGGILDDALTTSMEQLVIDDEMIRFIKRLRKPIVIDKESMGLEALKEGMAEYGCLLAEEHTTNHVRSGEMLDCGLRQWDSYTGWEANGKPDLYDLAHKKATDILASHEVADFDPVLKKEIERIAGESSGIFAKSK
jgi:Trimethylamine:corrinoid methyltransferase